MLTPFDDYLCHQTQTPMGVAGTSDRRFYSRGFFTFYDAGGDFVAIAGLGNYPNTGVQDGFAMLSISSDLEQRNIRMSRRLRGDPERLHVGPLSIEVIKPLHSFRVRCGANDQGFSWDIVCETISPPWERRPRFRPRRGGRVSDINCHFNQGYTCQGTLTVDGETRRVHPTEWFGVRDRSWGIGRFWEGDFSYGERYLRPESGTSAHVAQDRGLYGHVENPVGDQFAPHNSWVPFVRGDSRRYLALSFRPPVQSLGGSILHGWGDTREAPIIVGVERDDVTFRPDGAFDGCALRLRDHAGEVHVMEVRARARAWEGSAGYADMGTGFQMGRPMVDALSSSHHVEGETMSMAALGSHLRKQENLGAGSSTVTFSVCEYQWAGRTGFGSFEADPYEVAQAPFASFTPPEVRTRKD